LQWLQYPRELNVDNLNNARCEASRHFRNKKKEHQKGKINKIVMNSKNKNIRDLYRGINECKRGYNPINNLVREQNGDLLADFNTTVNKWKGYFSHLLNVDNISDVKQIKIHTAEPLIPGPSHLQVEISIAKLKKYKSPGSDQIRAEFYQAGGETLLSVIHKLITSIWNKEEMSDQWKESIIVPIHKIGNKTDLKNYRGISLLSTLYKIFITYPPFMDKSIHI
jgi:hypothetical protein